MPLTTIDYRAERAFPIIKFQGIIDYNGFLKAVRGWIAGHGYEFHEKSVKYKVPVPTGAEIELEWWGWKKINSYIRFELNLFFHIFDLHDVEVVRNGKKQKLQHLRMLIETHGVCITDYSGRFGGSKLMIELGNFFEKYIIHKDIDAIYSDQIYYQVYKLHQLMKEYLDFETKTNAFQDVW